MKSSSKNVLQDKPSCWEGYYKEFLKVLPSVSQSYSPRDIFCDACRCFCLSLRGAVTLSGIEKDAIEKEYQTYVEKYGKDGMQKIAILLSYVVEALELRRQDFLGHIQEELNSTTKAFGQFYTPDSVSTMMARMVCEGHDIKKGRIVKIGDPSCGAGALLIAGVEGFISAGGKQGDILVCGEDLDATACNIFYTQASLLGYAAIVTRMDSLSMKVYEGPWYTFGYFAHGMPMRLLAQRKEEWTAEKQPNEGQDVPRGTEENKPIEVNVRELVQGEFPF